jgi:hypothetical protein
VCLRFLLLSHHPETAVPVRATSDAVHSEFTFAHQKARTINLIQSVGVVSNQHSTDPAGDEANENSTKWKQSIMTDANRLSRAEIINTTQYNGVSRLIHSPTKAVGVQ